MEVKNTMKVAITAKRVVMLMMTIAVAGAMVACKGAVAPKVPPTPNKDLGDIVFTVGDGAKTISLTGTFNNATNPTYSATSSNKSVATVSVPKAKAVLTVTPGVAGITDVTVKVKADEGVSSQTFKVTVNAKKPPTENNPPTVRTISPVSLQVDRTKMITLSDYFTDPDSDALTYTASSDTPAFATVTEPDADSMITITAVAAGTATITVTASDDKNAAVRQTFDVTVSETPPNNPPTVRTISPVSLQVDRTKMITLSDYFTDPDSDALTYTASSDTPAFATVTEPDADSMITITAVAAGTATITVTASDDKNAAVRQTFDVTVSETPPNNPPTVRTIPDESLKVGKTESVILSRYADDPEDDALTYSATSRNDAVATASVAGAVLTIMAVAEGTATITVTVSDGTNSVDRDFDVEVTPADPVKTPNEPPEQTERIPHVDDLRREGTHVIDLSNHYFDPNGDDLTFTAVSSDETIASVSIRGSMLTITGEDVGMARVTITASDGKDERRQTISVTVGSQAPEPTTLPTHIPLDLAGISTQDIDLALYYDDPEGDDLTYTAEPDDTGFVTVTGPGDGSIITITAVAAGTAMITITAADGDNDPVKRVLVVTVRAPDVENSRPEVVNGINAMALRVGDDPLELDVSGNFIDPDANEGDTLTYTASSSMEMYAIAAADGPMITITAVAEGTTMIAVIASDSHGETATLRFTVTVNPPNMAPVVSSEIPNQSLEMDFMEMTELDLSMYFDDPDDGPNGTLMYTAEGSNMYADAEVEGSTLTVTAKAAGKAEITVTASDGEDSDKDMFTVTVANPDRPTRLRTLREQTFAHDDTTPRELTLSKYFSKATMYDIEVFGEGVVTAVEADGELTLTPVGAGNAEVEVTPSNSGGDGPSQTIDVTVAEPPTPQAPAIAVNFVPVRFAYGDMDPDTFTLSMYFTGATSYGVMSSVPSVATAEEAEGVLTITPVAAGDTVVTVTAINDAGQRTQNIAVNVAEPPTPQRPEIESIFAPVKFAYGDMDPDTFTLSMYFTGATSYGVMSSVPSVATAEEAEGVLTITPVAAGDTVVTVTAINDAGQRTQNIAVNVAEPPTPQVPERIKSLQAQTIVSDDSPRPIMLSEYFSGATDYDVSSNNEAALVASEAGGTLTLTPMKHGKATVTVTPSNSGGTGTAQTFDVTVQARPTQKKVDSLPDLRISLGGATDPVASELPDLSGLFEDPDGAAPLTYSTKTGDVKKVFVTESTVTTAPAATARDNEVMAEGKDVTLWGRAAGKATITVTVTDGDGLSTMKTFEVTVVAGANAAPTAVGGSIPDSTADARLKLGTPKKVIDNKAINGYFVDADLGGTPGDMLTFRVEYSSGTEPTPAQVGGAGPVKVTVDDADKIAADDRVATAMVLPTKWDGDDHGIKDKFTVTVTPKNAGANQRILIIATDIAGAEAVKSFEVQVNNAPEAQGAQAEPLMLRSFDSAEGLKSSDSPVDVPIVAPDGGYFSDKDMTGNAATSDTLTCSFRPSITGDTAPVTLAWDNTTGNDAEDNTESITLVVTPKTLYDSRFVDDMKVAVWCSDGVEQTAKQTFMVGVTAQASIH